jgi:hypothetical protein
MLFHISFASRGTYVVSSQKLYAQLSVPEENKRPDFECLKQDDLCTTFLHWYTDV